MSDGNKKNYDSNYFWSIIVDSIDVSIAPIRCGLVVCLTMLQWNFFLEMLLLERKVF